MANPQTEVDRYVCQFAESLKAPAEYVEVGRQWVHKIGQLIESRSRFSIAQKLVGGSVGKNTDVLAPDFDVVYAVNSHEPPFTDVLDDFEEILRVNEANLGILPGSINRRTYSIEFMSKNHVKVNLLPASNMIEPANPCNNLLQDQNADVIRKVAEFAGVTLKRVENLMAGKYDVLCGGQRCILFHKLLEPQPSKLFDSFPSGATKDIVVSMVEDYGSLYCDMKVWIEAPLKRKEVRGFLEVFKNNLHWIVNAAAREAPTPSTQQQQKENAKMVHEAASTQIETNLGISLGPGSSRTLI